MIHVEVRVIDCSRQGREIGSLCCKGRLNIGMRQYLSECGPQSYGVRLSNADTGILGILAKKSCSRKLKGVFETLANQSALKDRRSFCLNVLDSRLMQISVWR